MPIINLDSDKAKELGFTSDLFEGWLWIDDTNNEFLWISFIESLSPGKGNLKKLFDTIESKGYHLIVPSPFARMEMICKKRGMEMFDLIISSGDLCECMIKPNAFNQLKETCKPTISI
jgi:hypothetical protein